jgi:2-dehydro-3-deoxyphosphogluconate aldolase/(4S)-4-hydroxy-2-oxoglutarate aldolase
MNITFDELFKTNKIIPVLTLNNLDEAIMIAKTLVSGGIKVIEVTLRAENAFSIIRALTVEVPEIIVGAGTIINAKQYESAIEAGAKFIVSPGLTSELAKIHTKYKVPFMPGVITPSEVMEALSNNLTYLKFFPTSSFNAITTLKSYFQVFSKVKFCLTGGINLANMSQYLTLPNVVAIGTSSIIDEELVKQQNFTKVSLNIKEILASIKNI